MRRFLTLVLLASFSCQFAEASVQVQDSRLFAEGTDNFNFASNPIIGTTDFSSSVIVDFSNGDSVSTNTVSETRNGNETLLTFDISHSRDGDTFGDSAESRFQVVFSPSANSTYELFGNYDLNGTNQLFLQTVFFERGNAQLFGNAQQSFATVNQSFQLGGMAGDLNNSLQGSLTGSLSPNEVYDLRITAFTRAGNGTDGGATAEGQVVLRITENSTSGVIPEPTAFLVWGGLASCCALRMRRHK